MSSTVEEGDDMGVMKAHDLQISLECDNYFSVMWAIESWTKWLLMLIRFALQAAFVIIIIIFGFGFILSQ